MSQSHLDAPEIKQFIHQALTSNPSLSNSTLAAELHNQFGIPTSEKSIRRAKKRWGLVVESGPPTGRGPDKPHSSIKDDTEGDIVSDVYREGSTPSPEDLMVLHGLDPEEWEIVSCMINQWNGMTSDKASGDNRVVPLRQLKIHLVRKKPEPPFLIAARLNDPESYRQYAITDEQAKRLATRETKLVVFAGDQQAPEHNEELHELFCQWLQVNEPDEGVLIGDTVDFPDISRHRYNPERTSTVQECVNAGFRLLRDYRKASLGTTWKKLPGNHDERIRNTLIDWATEVYGVTRAQIDEEDIQPPVLGIEHLLRLQELGIEYIDPNGQYDQAQVNVTKYLAARHGWIAVKGSGASALKTLEHLGYSIVVGHTHRQSIVHKTEHDIDGTPTTLVGVETGCMCNLDGLGYTVAPDWQNGFATATIWPDGVFKIDLATYFDGTLAYRDQRYGELRK